MARRLAGKKPIYCKVCKGQCYRLSFQRSHFSGIKKELRDRPRRRDPKSKFGAKEGRVEARFGQPRYVHCPVCGEPRDLRGNPISSTRS